MTTKASCPACGSTNCYYRKTSDSWRCRRCKESFQVGSATSGVEHEEDTRVPVSSDVTVSEQGNRGFWAKLRGLLGGKTN